MSLSSNIYIYINYNQKLTASPRKAGMERVEGKEKEIEEEHLLEYSFIQNFTPSETKNF